METYCQDRDLLSIEPTIFLAGGLPAARLISGSGAQLAGTAFTCSGDLLAAGLEGGMVLCVYNSAPAEGAAYEVVSVDSSTEMTVSVLRADVEAAAVAPPAQSNVSFIVQTYSAQIANVSARLGEKLREISQTAGVAAADFADSAQLRLAAAYGALADIFVARAENAERYDANWIKAEHYRSLHRQILTRTRLAVDIDGDGYAEQTRSLGNTTLRRI